MKYLCSYNSNHRCDLHGIICQRYEVSVDLCIYLPRCRNSKFNRYMACVTGAPGAWIIGSSDTGGPLLLRRSDGSYVQVAQTVAFRSYPYKETVKREQIWSWIKPHCPWLRDLINTKEKVWLPR